MERPSSDEVDHSLIVNKPFVGEHPIIGPQHPQRSSGVIELGGELQPSLVLLGETPCQRSTEGLDVVGDGPCVQNLNRA